MNRLLLLALVAASGAGALVASQVVAGEPGAVGGVPSLARPEARVGLAREQPGGGAASAAGSLRVAGSGAAAGSQVGGSQVGGSRVGGPEGQRGAAPRLGTRWRWPVRPKPPVLRPFRAPVSDYGAGHRGLDLAVAAGTQVRAVEGGLVTHAGVVAGRGTVTVAHADGLSSTYEPLHPAVAAGAVVTVGDVIGTLRPRDGPGHCGARACLHLGARRGESYLDPYPLLAGGRLALLPLG